MLRIMIVDDDFLICEELKGIVTDLEYEVAGVAGSGRAAVEMALDVKPDVILMDIVMDNGMDNGSYETNEKNIHSYFSSL